MRSSTLNLNGPVHLAEWGEGPVRIVLVHGLGGSHLNWMAVAPELAGHGRVVAPDLCGFGRTPAAGRRTTVAAQRALIHQVLTAIAHEPVILVGNSMGGLVSLLETALHPDRIAGLILVDAALPPPLRSRVDPLVLASFLSYLVPGLGVSSIGQLRRRIGHEEMVRRTLGLCAADVATIPAEVVDAHIALSHERGGLREADRAYVSAARSILYTQARWRRLRRMMQRISTPTLVLHGDHDRLVNIKAARRAHRLRPDWDLVVLDGVGHIPQMEAAGRFMSAVDGWLEARGLGTAGQAGLPSIPVAAADLV